MSIQGNLLKKPTDTEVMFLIWTFSVRISTISITSCYKLFLWCLNVCVKDLPLLFRSNFSLFNAFFVCTRVKAFIYIRLEDSIYKHLLLADILLVANSVLAPRNLDRGLYALHFTIRILPCLIQPFAGITLLFSEPSEARKPNERWRLYVFKDGEPLNGESFNPLSIYESNGSFIFYIFT